METTVLVAEVMAHVSIVLDATEILVETLDASLHAAIELTLIFLIKLYFILLEE